MADHRSHTHERIDLYRRKRWKNLLVAGLLLVFIVFVFILSMVRMGGST